jgi:hypothetical protein
MAFMLDAIDSNTVGLAFDIILYFVIGLIALGFIIGMIRGIWKESFRFAFVSLLGFITLFYTKEITDFVLNYDFSSTFQSDFSIVLGQWEAITVPISSPYLMLESFLTQFLTSYNLVLTPTINEVIITFSTVVARYVIFVLLVIFIALLGEFFAWILYIFPVSLFIPTVFKKKIKLRLIAGAMGATKVAIISALLLTPFTSIINIFNSAFKTFDDEYGEQITNATYNQIMGFLNAYDDSIFSQVLFNWYVSADGQTLDTQVIDFITSETIDGLNYSLTEELTTVANLTATFIGAGITDGFSNTFLAALATEQVTSNVLLSLTGSTLILKILPIAVALALQTEEAQTFVDPSLLNLETVNWTEELENINDIALSIFDSGILNSIIGEDPLTPNEILTSLLSEESYPSIRQALLLVDDSQFISQVLPAVLYKLSTDELEAGLPEGSFGLSTFLPALWEDYESLAFGSELVVITDAMFRLVTEAEGLLPALLEYFSTDGDPEVQPGIKARKLAMTQEEIVDVLRENIDLIINAFIGDTDANGEPININNINGKSTTSQNLFDSDLLLRGLGNILSIVLGPTLEGFLGNADQTNAINSTITLLNGTSELEKRINYKKEFAAILGMVGAMIQNDTLYELLNPTEGEASTDIISLLNDAAFRAAIKTDILKFMDRSEMMIAIIPSVLESTLSDPSFEDFLSILDLSAEDFNFDFRDVGTQLGIFLDIIGYSFSVLEAGDDIMGQFGTIKNDLVGLLDSMYMSSIINPKDDTGAMSSDNYYNLVIGIFSMVESLSIDRSDLETAVRAVTTNLATGHDGWTTVFNDQGEVVTAGENFNLINFLDTVLNSGLFDLDPNEGDLISQMVDLLPTDENPEDPIGDIFDSVNSSIIISSTFGKILDGFFGSTGGLIDEDLGTSFTNVTDWSIEGDTLKLIIGSLSVFSDGLENIDFLNSDPSFVADILKALAQSQIFLQADDSYVFPDFLLNKLKGTGDGSDSVISQYLYDPYEDSSSGSPYDVVTNDFYNVGNTRSTAENWYSEDGEIDAIVGFIEELNSVGGDDPVAAFTGAEGITSETIETLLIALNESQSLRILLYNMFEVLLGTSEFNVGALSPSDANTYAVLNMGYEDRKIEIGHIATLYGAINAMSINAGGTFSMETLTEDTISEVGNMLHAMHDSKMFNTFDITDPSLMGVPRSHANGDLTVFEQTIKFVLETSTLDTFIYEETDPSLRSNLLFTDIISLENNFADQTQGNDEWNSEEGEINAITNIMIAFKSTNISFDSFGGDGANAMGNLLAEEQTIDDQGTIELEDDVVIPSGVDRIENLLLNINHSRLVSPAIANLFDEIFNSGSFSLESVNLSDANTAFFKDPTFDIEDKNQEISLLLDVYVSINNLDLNNGGSLTVDKIDEEAIENMLLDLHQSKVFNTFKTGLSYATNDLTVFEQTIRMILDVSQLDTYIYNGIPNTAVSLFEDISGIDNNFAGTVTELTDGWNTLGTGEIYRIGDILSSFKSTDIDFSLFSGSGSNDVLADLTSDETGTNKLKELLISMNRSKIVYPAIPSLFDNLLSAGDVGGIDLDFSMAYTQYRGQRMTDIAQINLPAYQPYDEEEINTIIDIFLDIKALADINFTDLSAVNNNVFDSMRELVEQFNQSEIFHLQGPATESEADATIFEQIMIKLMNDTGIANLIYDNAVPNPNPNYFDGLNPLFISGSEKADFLVMNFESLFVNPTSLHFQDGFMQSTWEEEMIAFFNIFKEMKRVLPALGSASTLDPSNLSPNSISAILSVLTYSNLAFDSVPYLLKDAFDAINFDTFSEGQQDYFKTPEVYLSSDLNQVNYSTTNFTTLNPPTDQTNGVIIGLLNAFFDDGAYIDVSDNFDFAQYLTENSSFNLIQFLDQSTIFGNIVSTQTYRTRSLIFYNILATIDADKYLDRGNPTRNKHSRVQAVEDVFYVNPLDLDDPIFDDVYEADKLDAFIGVLADLTNVSGASASGLGVELSNLMAITFDAITVDGSNPLQIPNYFVNLAISGDEPLFERRYVNRRAYLISELAAGFFTDVFEGEYERIDFNPDPAIEDNPSAIDFYSNDHLNMNPLEVKGILGSLQMITVMSSITADPNNVSQADLDDLSFYFAHMGSLVATNTTGGPFGTNNFDYSTWDSSGNSSIATIFYASRIATDQAFIDLNAILFGLTFDPFNPSALVQLNPDAYSTNFVFEIEGQKIRFVLGS